MVRATKIVATMGPSCQDDPVFTNLFKAGVNIARMNFSHGSYKAHGKVFDKLKRLRDELGVPISILQDLQGPKIRIGELNKVIEIKNGELVTLTTDPISKAGDKIPVDFPELPDCVYPGGRILIDDGAIELRVLTVKDNLVNAQVVNGGIVKPNKGINLPGVKLPIAALTKKDIEDLAFGLKHNIDAVALSFVQSAQDVITCRKAVKNIDSSKEFLPIIAKIERPEALDNIDDIIDVADGVMVARGDLGVEMSSELVPIAQKKIIECANRNGKIVITATQMLESMINHPRPTRAEASDVANAILDGTDAVMLSGETAVGKYPIQTVHTMDAIICQAETHMGQWGRDFVLPQAGSCSTDDTYYIAQAAKALASDRNVSAIAVFTQSGRTARVMAKMRPDVPILAFTSHINVLFQMPMYWGVQAHLVPHANSISQMLREVDEVLKKETKLQSGQQVVLICGYPIEKGLPANLALIHTIGSDAN